MQGDEYDISLVLTCSDGEILTGDQIDTLEVTLGDLRFVYPATITFDAVANAFVLHLTQEQTFGVPSGEYMMQMRIKTLAADVYGQWNVQSIRIIHSRSKVVL